MKLRFPNYMTTAQDGGNVVSPTHRPFYPQEMFLVLISDRVDPRATLRQCGSCHKTNWNSEINMTFNSATLARTI